MKRVLVVDDDEDVLQSLASVLEDRYAISVAQNGEVALQQVMAAPFDAIVLDMMMPVMDGAEFMEAMHKQGKRVPVILMSAGTEVRARAQQIGAADFLSKPFELSVLEEKLERILARSTADADAATQR
jgi:DNA-binding response OmpR family regulator